MQVKKRILKNPVWDLIWAENTFYEERLAELHIELEGLNEEAMTLAKTIADNYKALAL